MLRIELFLISRGIQHEDTGDACSLPYWFSYCIFWSDQRCSWLKAYVLSHSYFPLDAPFFSNQILLVNWYSFYCLWILYFWFLTLLNIDCFSLMISFDCRAKCSVAASIKWAFKFFLFTNVPQPITRSALCYRFRAEMLVKIDLASEMKFIVFFNLFINLYIFTLLPLISVPFKKAIFKRQS